MVLDFTFGGGLSPRVPVTVGYSTETYLISVHGKLTYVEKRSQVSNRSVCVRSKTGMSGERTLGNISFGGRVGICRRDHIVQSIIWLVLRLVNLDTTNYTIDDVWTLINLNFTSKSQCYRWEVYELSMCTDRRWYNLSSLYHLVKVLTSF